jgi:hypothetical protein
MQKSSFCNLILAFWPTTLPNSVFFSKKSTGCFTNQLRDYYETIIGRIKKHLTTHISTKTSTLFTILPYAVYKKKFFFRNICIVERKSVILPSNLMRRLQFTPPPEKGVRGVLVSKCAHTEMCAHTRQNKP